MRTTIYMFNESAKEFDDVIKHEKLEGDDSYNEVFPIDPLPYEARFFFQKRKKPPPWLGFIKDRFDTTDFENQSCSFLILIKTNGRIFAITKGYAAFLFDRKKLEDHFGLKVCLNEIDSESIKCLDSRSLETNAKQKRVIINNNSLLRDFNFNADIELLNLISGNPVSEDFAKSMTGSDPISFTRDEITIEQLEDICKELLVSFNKTDYQEQFSFIDFIKPITDENRIDELMGYLLRDFNELIWEKFVITYPDIPDFENIDHWKLSYHHNPTEYDEMNKENMIDFISRFGKSHGINPDEISVTCINNSGEVSGGRKCLDDFITYEIELADGMYVYARHKWYSFSTDFLTRINSNVNSIQVEPVGFLPEWGSNLSEGEYNEKVANSSINIINMDKKLLTVEGRGKIEVCDLLEKPNTLIHIKKHYGSQSLGHLFNQGTISAQVLRTDRSRVSNWFRTKHPTIDVAPIEELDMITVVFAIGFNNYDKSPITKIPFFSKVALYNARKIIENTCGFSLKICSIPIIEKTYY